MLKAASKLFSKNNESSSMMSLRDKTGITSYSLCFESVLLNINDSHMVCPQTLLAFHDVHLLSFYLFFCFGSVAKREDKLETSGETVSYPFSASFFPQIEIKS